MMEPGQKAHEVFKREWGCEPGWGNLSARYKAAWAAVEAACVPAVPADVEGLVERLSELVRHGNENRISIVSVAVDLVDNTASALQAQAAEIERLRERLGPRGLEVVMIDGTGHYVSAAVAAKLREAVEVMRDLLDWADDYQRWGTTPTHDALSPARAFLATMEKTDDPH